MPKMQDAFSTNTTEFLRLLGRPAAEEILGPSIRPIAELLSIDEQWQPPHWDDWDKLHEKERDLVLMASVGTLKSSWMVLKKAQLILKDPIDCTILHTSSTARLAERMSTQLQRIITSKPVVEVFGDLQGDPWNKGDWSVVSRDPMQKTPTMVAVGVGNSVEGDRFRHLHGDDPCDLKDAISEVVRHGKMLWYKQTAVNRLNRYDPLRTRLFIGSRWHRRDLFGEIAFTQDDKPRPGITYVAYPAERDGRPLFPTLYPAELLREIRTDIGESAYEMRYLCNPTALEGHLLKVDWLENLIQHPTSVPPWAELDVVQGWDFAFTSADVAGTVAKPKAAEDRAWTVCVTLGHHAETNKFWILHIYRVRIGGDHARHIQTLWRTMHHPRRIYVETNSFKVLLHDLEQTTLPYSPVDQHTDKVTRIRQLEPYFERDLFRMAEDLKHRFDFFSEYEQFPYGRFVDILDALRTAMRGYLEEGTSGWTTLRL